MRMLRTLLFAILLTGVFRASAVSGHSYLAPPDFPFADSTQSTGAARVEEAGLPAQPQAAAAYVDQPIFRYPVVPDAVISGYFDHNPSGGLVTFYNGRKSNSGAGFYFSCSNPSMYDWVGCEDGVSGEGACSNSRELWYDGHKGTDYEYAANWHTGAVCDPGRFAGITRQVYAPAAGQVLMAGTDPNRPANGWHIRLKHDLNGNGNYNDDNFRSVYLHFTANALAVTAGQVISEGTYLGLGGSTGYSSSPHLHFEVQRSSDYFNTNYWSVDPYGWQGSGSDPWPYQNVKLFRFPVVNFTDFVYLPVVTKSQSACQNCGNVLLNGGFEAGHSAWVEEGVMIIVRDNEPSLPVAPYAGEWLAWLGGRNNAEDVLNQDFVVPQGASSGRLRYALRVSTTETIGGQDYFYIRLRKTDGTVLQEALVDNAFSPKNQWVVRDLNLINLSAYQGQTLRINFKAITDASNITHFYLDEVSLSVTAQ